MRSTRARFAVLSLAVLAVASSCASEGADHSRSPYDVKEAPMDDAERAPMATATPVAEPPKAEPRGAESRTGGEIDATKTTTESIEKRADRDAPAKPSEAPSTGDVLANKQDEASSALRTKGSGRAAGGAGLYGASALANAQPGPAPRPMATSVPMAPPPPPKDAEHDKRAYDPAPDTNGPVAGGTFAAVTVNPFIDPREDRLSTFAIDVDTASYTFARQFLARGTAPPAGGVRVEEWINAFHYEYASPESNEHPFAVHLAAAPSPLDGTKHLVRVAIQGKRVAKADRKPVHLTFLVDVSGSMSADNRLGLAKRSLHLLVDELGQKDTVGLVTYAGSTQVILEQTRGSQKQKIHDAIDRLSSGGGTNMGSGMELAYKMAHRTLGDDSESRVIVLSDGDANIGRTSHAAILKSIAGYVSEGVTMSTVGFGTGIYRDYGMEQLANAGNGNYTYIDDIGAAKKAFVEDLTGTLQVIAQDTKIQVELDPSRVARYRLLGYENRAIADHDFRNDKVDAGEVGAGHAVTALYEIELADQEAIDDAITVRIRYKQPRGTKATEVVRALSSSDVSARFGDLDRDAQLAASLALAAEVLRGSPYAEGKTLDDALALARETVGGPYAEERKAYVDLLERAASAGVHARPGVALR